MLLNDVQEKVGIKFKQIGVPQPDQIYEATNNFSLKALSRVNEHLLDKFNTTADILIEQNGNDTKKALLKTLAYMSGYYLKPMPERSI